MAVGLLLGFAGIAMILAPGSGPEGGMPVSYGLGLLLVLASVAWAAGAVFSRHVHARGSALLATARQMIVAGVVLLLVARSTGISQGSILRRSACARGWASSISS